jgi:hypothetical protein
MKTLDEVMKEFKSISDTERKDWINNLQINELRLLRDGLEKALPWKGKVTYLYYVEELIISKIEENRNEKLKNIGI